LKLTIELDYILDLIVKVDSVQANNIF